MRQVPVLLALIALLTVFAPAQAVEQPAQLDISTPGAGEKPERLNMPEATAAEKPAKSDTPEPGPKEEAAENDIPEPEAEEEAAQSELAQPWTNADAGLLQILQDHSWSLTAATDAKSQAVATLVPVDANPYSLNFSGSMLYFQGGCNSFSGDYAINAKGELSVAEMLSTMMACKPELMEADTALAAILAQPLNIMITWGAPPQLQLRTTANEILILAGAVTPEAVYGTATLIFLEVDAQLLPCRNPLNTQTTCLQVREVSFDEKGLRSAIAGPWQPFYDDIAGYTHVPGERNVLRVKRFEQDAAAGIVAPAVYVLDLIIETEIVSKE